MRSSSSICSAMESIEPIFIIEDIPVGMLIDGLEVEMAGPGNGSFSLSEGFKMGWSAVEFGVSSALY